MNRKEISHRYYLKHKEQILEKKRIYNRINAKNITKQRRQYYLKNKLLFKLLHKTYNLTHKQELEEYRKLYEESHKEERRIYNSNYYKKNKKELNIKRNLYFIKRRKENIDFKLRCNLRSRIWEVLKGNTKYAHIEKLIGCTIEHLKLWLELQFTQGMSWKNYGLWHVDHIKRCADFDLSKKSEQLKCFNYSNLQPLWAYDNLVKHCRI